MVNLAGLRVMTNSSSGVLHSRSNSSFDLVVLLTIITIALVIYGSEFCPPPRSTFYIQKKFSPSPVWSKKLVKGPMSALPSVFQKATVKFYVDLSDTELGRIIPAAKDYIAGCLFCYEQREGGVVLAYSNVRPFQKYLRCHADLPYCHIKMLADVLLFKPYPGCELPATVTFVSSSAINLQIIDTFRGYVNMQHLRKNWYFKDEKWHLNDGNQSFTAYENVVVLVEDVMGSSEGLVMNVRVLRRSDVPVQATIEDEETYAE